MNLDRNVLASSLLIPIVDFGASFEKWRQVKDVVKGIKKKLKSKHPKVQILALTLLECMLKNCGDIVHMHVADRNILPEMVKMYKKRSDYGLKEKILLLVDTWQEDFGGARAVYPHYFMAYQELLRAGAVFPQRNERSQTQPENSQTMAVGISKSSTEIENVRSIMNELADMLNAFDPNNKQRPFFYNFRELSRMSLLTWWRSAAPTNREFFTSLIRLRSSSIAFLAMFTDFFRRCLWFILACMVYELHWWDESLLRQGLDLNEDLQLLLAKHQAIASGNSSQLDNNKPEPTRETGNSIGPLADPGDIGHHSIASHGRTLALGFLNNVALLQGLDYDEDETYPSLVQMQVLNIGNTAPAAATPKIDLLSCNDFDSSNADNLPVIVPFGEAQETSPVPQQKVALPYDMFPDGNNSYDSSNTQGLTGQTNPWTPQFQQHEHNFHGNIDPTGNSQLDQQEPYPSPAYALPPPPWEAQPADCSPIPGAQYPQPMVSTYSQLITTGHFSATNNNRAMQGSQFASFHPQQSQEPQCMGMVPPQMVPYNQQEQQMYGNPQMEAPSGYEEQQYLDQQVHGLSIIDDNGLINSSYQVSSSSNVPPGKSSQPEDEAFGDPVNMTQVKPPTNTPGTPGTM
ncbi:hypothetical protein F3Y22_tig00000340pilonHSYRG00078 [Hibiscus syriacus]|uniref:VHS domain-containing protein n=1 Tax=Hibiscus syriacus TaxID=106335 RepID=A0A6A3D7N1_HIBSY|nr:hypothetical protein F3Y22_tig00000340pilonHSYRG00078 [Hibiscus syriacus]